MVGGSGCRARAGPPHTSAAVLAAPDQAQAGPVLVDSGDLDVDEPDRQRVLADDLIGDVTAVPAGPPRPGGPHRPGRIDAPGETVEPLGDLTGGGEEGDNEVGRTVGLRVQQAGRRVGQRPPRRRVAQLYPLPGLEAELGGLGPGGGTVSHAPPSAAEGANGFPVAGTSTAYRSLTPRSMPCSAPPRHSAGSRSMTSRRPGSSTARRSGWRPPSSTGCLRCTWPGAATRWSTRSPTTCPRPTRSSTSRWTTSTPPSTNVPRA